MTLRVVFFGTPEAAVPILTAVGSAFDLGLVVTQPDRARGRSKRLVAPPVKDAAVALGVPVAQPSTRLELESLAEGSRAFDVGVVVAYGRILPKTVLDFPAAGHLNVHFSLLPRWRGAAPVARALMASDSMTGVTIIQLDEGLDTGPVLTAQAVDIDANEDAGELTNRLSHLGARLLTSSLERFVSGEDRPVPQSDEGVTYADKLTHSDRPLPLDADAATVVARVRGLSPTPAATLSIDAVPHKILAARTSDADVPAGEWSAVGDRLVAGTRDGSFEIVELQPPGRTRQGGDDWIRGKGARSGTIS